MKLPGAAQPIENRKKINLSFRVTEDRQEQLKIAGARRRLSIQQMIEAGLDLLLLENGNTVLTSKSTAERTKNADYPRTVPSCSTLRKILSSGDVIAIEAVERVIVACERLIELGKVSSGEVGANRDPQRDPAAEASELLEGSKGPQTGRPKTRKGTGTRRGG